MNEIKKELFEYISDKYLPVLFLAKNSTYNLPKDKKVETLEYIAHQTAGFACNQHYLVGKILSPKDKTLIAMYKLEKEYLESNSGFMNTSLDEIISYRQKLNQLLGVDCNHTYTHFEEGIYPIDYSKETIEKLVKKRTLKETRSFMKQVEKMDRLPCINLWNIFILGQNSD